MLDSIVKIAELNSDNWYECCLLELEEQQKNYIEPNAISIAQSRFEPTLRTFAIYFDDKIVGFLMFNTIQEELDGLWIYRIMVDKKYQNKGIGKKAAQLMINEMAKIPNIKRIVVGYRPNNHASHHLWASLGFVDNGDRFGKEMAVVLDL